MARAPTFDEVLQLAERLSLDDKEAMVDVLKKRTLEARRRQLAREVRRANEEHRRGKTRRTTPEDLMREILR